MLEKSKDLAKMLFTVIGVATFAITAFIMYSPFTVVIDFSVSFVLEYLLVFSLVLILYWSWGGVGTETGYNAERYVNAHGQYLIARDKIKGVNQTKLFTFCRKWSDDELAMSRTRILWSANISYDEWNSKYRDMEIKTGFRAFVSTFTRRNRIDDKRFKRSQLRAIAKVNRMKPITLTPAMLLTCDNGKSARDRMTSPFTKAMRRAFADILPIATTLIFSVGITGIIFTEGQDRLRIVFVMYLAATAAIKGYISKYKNIAVDTAEYREKQSRRIDEFIACEASGGNANQSTN